MGSTFSSLQVHVVFSTKDRRPSLKPAIDGGLYPYVNGILKQMNIVPLAIGGVEDHVHLLLGIRPTHRLSDAVRDLKRASSLWVSERHTKEFDWQDGYSAFSVGASGIASVKAYIAGQEEHHRKVSYLDELRSFLEEAGIPYEDRFLV